VRRDFNRDEATMHEYSVVQAFIERVECEARARGASTVHRLSVRVGEASGVDVELFETAYATFRERTLCAHADLCVQVVPVRWSCERCGTGPMPGQRLRCPRCDGRVRLLEGDELVLDRIEMEVP
jgi:hydrogenase nickel incorporation protein HypA/HybF